MARFSIVALYSAPFDSSIVGPLVVRSHLHYMAPMHRALVGVMFGVLGCKGSAAIDLAPAGQIAFVREGSPVRTISLADLGATVSPVTWTAYDPLYGKAKRFRTLPVGPVLSRGFAGLDVPLSAQEFVLRASDGYVVLLPGSILLQEGAYFALTDDEVPKGWEPIGAPDHRPSPLYLVWRLPNQTDVKEYPRPWGIVSIEIASFAQTYARTIPTGEAPDSEIMRGFSTFRQQCLKCHSVNGQGGKLGPELNRPKNITEYRSSEVLQGFIRNPQAYRESSSMPPQPQLTDPQLHEIIAYFQAMRIRKQGDPKSSESVSP